MKSRKIKYNTYYYVSKIVKIRTACGYTILSYNIISLYTQIMYRIICKVNEYCNSCTYNIMIEYVEMRLKYTPA